MKKNWIKVKCGLILEPKHRLAMGECVWLYLYMVHRTNYGNGRLEAWKDIDGAEGLGMSVAAVREQRRKLERTGYISVRQRQHSQEIEILKWIDPRNPVLEGYTRDTPSKRDQDEPKPTPSPHGQGTPEAAPLKQNQGDPKPAPSEIQGDTQGDSSAIPSARPYPYLFNIMGSNKNAQPVAGGTPLVAIPDRSIRRPRRPKASPDVPPSEHKTLMAYLHEQFGPYADGKAQGEAVRWLLEQKYSVEDCKACLGAIADWDRGRISWLTVQKHIATWKHRGTSAPNGNGQRADSPSRIVGGAAPKPGKYANLEKK